MAASRAAKRGRATPNTKRFGQSLPEEGFIMAYITAIDAFGITPKEYRAILDEMGFELRSEPGIYLHLTAPIEGGYRVIEVWDHRAGFEAFMQDRLAPAAAPIGLNREMKVTIEPLLNTFAPRLNELPPLVEAAFLRPNAPVPA